MRQQRVLISDEIDVNCKEKTHSCYPTSVDNLSTVSSLPKRTDATTVKENKNVFCYSDFLNSFLGKFLEPTQVNHWHCMWAWNKKKIINPLLDHHKVSPQIIRKRLEYTEAVSSKGGEIHLVRDLNIPLPLNISPGSITKTRPRFVWNYPTKKHGKSRTRWKRQTPSNENIQFRRTISEWKWETKLKHREKHCYRREFLISCAQCCWKETKKMFIFV